MPLSRLLFVFLLAGSFAVAFAGLVRHADRQDPPAFAACGAARSLPCPPLTDMTRTGMAAAGAARIGVD